MNITWDSPSDAELQWLKVAGRSSNGARTAVVEVLIERVSDGARRIHQHRHGPVAEGDEDDPIEAIRFMWHEGNYSCDCNRELFFLRAMDEDEPDEPSCGHGRYRVVEPEWLRDGQ